MKNDKGKEAFEAYCKECPFRLDLGVERRPGNALNVEVGADAPRCLMKAPKNWGKDAPSPNRWLASGGSPLVFGKAGSRARCPLKPNHCRSCGHFPNDHFRGYGCIVQGDGGESCGCTDECP